MATLNEFQLDMYKHLFEWKKKQITHENREYEKKGDLLLKKQEDYAYPHIYPEILPRLMEHHKRFHFKFHRFANHMASSQVACFNLFLPLLNKPDQATIVLRSVKRDLKRIATERLDNGFRFEFWDEDKSNDKYKGLLNDHNKVAGTDSDLAIAYYDRDDNLNLWLIEHKFLESDFTPCGGAKSKGRTERHRCDSMKAVWNQEELCYYHDKCRYTYWEITKQHNEVFRQEALLRYEECPFKYGLNQLWRNLLLALGIENSASSDWPYKTVYFSVVHHPRNTYLFDRIDEFKTLIGNDSRFFSFGSGDLIKAAESIHGQKMQDWIQWYKALYLI